MLDLPLLILLCPSSLPDIHLKQLSHKPTVGPLPISNNIMSMITRYTPGISPLLPLHSPEILLASWSQLFKLDVKRTPQKNVVTVLQLTDSSCPIKGMDVLTVGRHLYSR